MLNFRNNGSLKVEGPVRINGRLVKSIDEIASVSAYVQQDDMFVETLTVSEHLIFHVLFHLRIQKIPWRSIFCNIEFVLLLLLY